MQQNPCIRCGKARVDGKVWTEMAGLAVVTHTQTVCPDSACQKIVDEEFAARREKRALLTSKRGFSANKIKSNREKKSVS